MENIEFDILKDKFVNKMTLAQIGKKYKKTGEGIRHILNGLYEKLLYRDKIEKWKIKNKIPDNIDEQLLSFIFFVEHRYKEKIVNLINKYDIKKPADFLLMPRKTILSEHNIGQFFFLNFKLAMLKFGLPYDSDDYEIIETKKIKLIQKNKKIIQKISGYNFRFKILERDNFTCQYCGRNPRDDIGVILHVDHIIPVTKGGSWDENNLITACRECNIGKSNKILIKK